MKVEQSQPFWHQVPGRGFQGGSSRPGTGRGQGLTCQPRLRHPTATPGGAAAGGRSNLGWEREDVVLMIAFDFVIMAVITLSGNLKYSAWKCSQILAVIQKEGKIVFLSAQTEPTIKKNPSRPPLPPGWAGSCPATGPPCSSQYPCGVPGCRGECCPWEGHGCHHRAPRTHSSV